MANDGSTFKGGEVIETSSGAPIRIISLIGEGGQGEVYKVECKGREMALKWYKQGVVYSPDDFYSNLVNNVKRGAPNDAFLWPKEVTKRTRNSFGYVMELRPSSYIEMKKLMLCGKDEKRKTPISTFKAVIQACIEITDAFRQLHKDGYSYQDMNAGNFFIEPRTGHVLICDNDNVAPNGTFTGIIGTPQYMAPEIVTGESMPNLHSDRFSLAVVLFYLLSKNHPLEGSHWVYAVPEPDLDTMLYGTDALFIYDPKDADNRPVPGIHDNIIKLWKVLPEYMKSIFIRAFSQESIKDPNRRVTEQEFLAALTRLQNEVVKCPNPNCESEIFVQNASATSCDKCGKTFSPKNRIVLHGYKVAAAPMCRFYRCQISICNVDNALDLVADILANPDDPNMLGIMNTSGRDMIGTTPSGKKVVAAHGEIIPMIPGIKLEVFNGQIVIE